LEGWILSGSGYQIGMEERMKRHDKAGPAFPVDASEGMTLRDYFAAKAMQAFLQNTETTYRQDAVCAYKMADAMLEARK